MNLRTLNKSLLATSAVALLAFGATSTSHAVDQTINATFATAAGITVAAGTALDFGTWVVDYQDGPNEEIGIVIPPTLGGTAPGVPTPVVVNEGTSASGRDTVIVNVTPPATSGTFTVTTPAAGPVQISAVVSTPYTVPALVLDTLTYDTANEGPANVPSAADGTTVVTVATGGTPEPIAIGGRLVIGGTLAAGTTFDPAVITVSLVY